MRSLRGTPGSFSSSGVPRISAKAPPSAWPSSTPQVIIASSRPPIWNTQEYRLLLEPLLNGLADVVYGSRFLSAGRQRVLYYWCTSPTMRSPRSALSSPMSILRIWKRAAKPSTGHYSKAFTPAAIASESNRSHQ
jgi:hypothetical protein